MRRFGTRLLTAMVVLGLSLPVLAAETKEEKMTSDQTQQNYTRKSITYLGILNAAGAPDQHMALIEQGIRKKLELKRFDYNAVSLGGVYTIDQLDDSSFGKIVQIGSVGKFLSGERLAQAV